MNLTGTFNIIRIISAFLLILFSVFLVNQKKGNVVSYRFLAVFLLARAGILIGMIVWSYRIWKVFPHIAYLETPLLFLYAPMLYLSAQAVIEPAFKWRVKYYLHLVPCCIILIFLIFKFYIHSIAVKLVLIEKDTVFLPLPATIISHLLWIQFVLYVSGSIILLKGYRNRIKSYDSTMERINLSWLYFLLLVFFVWKAIFISGYLFQILPAGRYYKLFQIFIEISFLVYASMIVYKGLQLPQLFTSNGHFAKYKTSPLQQEDKLRYLEKIETQMVNLVIYNSTGEQIINLFNGFSASGVNRIKWDGSDDKGQEISSGIYFYELSGSGIVQQRKMLLLK